MRRSSSLPGPRLPGFRPASGRCQLDQFDLAAPDQVAAPGDETDGAAGQGRPEHVAVNAHVGHQEQAGLGPPEPGDEGP